MLFMKTTFAGWTEMARKGQGIKILSVWQGGIGGEGFSPATGGA